MTKQAILSMLLVVWMFVSCSKDEPQKVSMIVSQSGLTYQGGIVKISVHANCDWALTCDRSATINTKSGNGNAEASITIPINKEYKDITYTVVLTSSDASSTQSASITQEESPGLKNDNETDIILSGKDTSLSIKVKTNEENIQLEGLPHWMKYTGMKSRALQNKTCEFTIEENLTGVERKATLVLKGEKDKITYKITQDYVKVYIESLKVSPSNILFQTNEPITLKPSYVPENVTEKNLVWRTDNPAVAIVDGNGVATAVNTGKCNIILTDKETDLICSVPVEVKIKATFLGLHHIDLCCGETIEIPFTHKPENAYLGDITSTSSDTSICTTDGLYLTANRLNTGTTNITVTDNYSGLSSTLSTTVSLCHIINGIYGAFKQLAEGGTEIAYGIGLYSNAPETHIEILSATLLTKDNQLKAICNIVQKRKGYAFAYTDRFNTLTLFGVEFPLNGNLDGIKFLVTYKVNGEQFSEEIPIKTGNRINFDF